MSLSLRAIIGNNAGLLSAALLWCACAGELDNVEDFIPAGQSTQFAQPTDADAGQPVDPIQPTQPVCGDVFNEVLVPKCANCHSGQASFGGFDLISSGLPARMLDKRAVQTCGGVLVPRANPTSGFFMAKLGVSVSCGSPMPIGSALLTQDQLTCVGKWLETMAVGP